MSRGKFDVLLQTSLIVLSTSAIGSEVMIRDAPAQAAPSSEKPELRK